MSSIVRRKTNPATQNNGLDALVLTHYEHKYLK